jgi:hypothetical protein
MSRTYHATGTGSFTRASEVRKDRSLLRQKNEAAFASGTAQELEPMHGATSEHREGKISYEKAMEIIKAGDKIRTPDGVLHVVNAKNKAELVGRLGATVTTPAKDFGRAAKGKNVEQRGTSKVYKGNLSDGTAKISNSGQRGAAPRVPNTKLGRAINQVLPKGILEGIGRGSKTQQGPEKGFGFKPQVGPVSTYKAGGKAKETAIKGGQRGGKGNEKLNARVSKVGGFAPKSSRATVTKAYAARRAANEKQRKADRKAGIEKPVVKRGPRQAPPAGTTRSTGRVKGVGGSRINLTRKGGRSGRGRSK